MYIGAILGEGLKIPGEQVKVISEEQRSPAEQQRGGFQIRTVKKEEPEDTDEQSKTLLVLSKIKLVFHTVLFNCRL